MHLQPIPSPLTQQVPGSKSAPPDSGAVTSPRSQRVSQKTRHFPGKRSIGGVPEHCSKQTAVTRREEFSTGVRRRVANSSRTTVIAQAASSDAAEIDAAEQAIGPIEQPGFCSFAKHRRLAPSAERSGIRTSGRHCRLRGTHAGQPFKKPVSVAAKGSSESQEIPGFGGSRSREAREVPRAVRGP